MKALRWMWRIRAAAMILTWGTLLISLAAYSLHMGRHWR